MKVGYYYASREGGGTFVDENSSIKTKVRVSITPYLPPPAIKAISYVDSLPFLQKIEEPSMTIVGTLALALLLLHAVRFISNIGGGRAIVEEEDAVLRNLLSKEEYGDTVLLCGPSGSGKTLLFYVLCHGITACAGLKTVTSLQANTGYAGSSVDNGDDKSKRVRIVDYPGHASLQSHLIQALEKAQRVVLVLDATKTVAAAADVLYDILKHEKARLKRKEHLSVMIVCNKTQLSGAKNWRRIKIQLRTELDRLRKTREDGVDVLGKKPLDLDQIGSVGLSFLSVSCFDPSQGMDALQDFVFTGEVPEETRSTIVRVNN